MPGGSKSEQRSPYHATSSEPVRQNRLLGALPHRGHLVPNDAHRSSSADVSSPDDIGLSFGDDDLFGGGSNEAEHPHQDALDQLAQEIGHHNLAQHALKSTTAAAQERTATGHKWANRVEKFGGRLGAAGGVTAIANPAVGGGMKVVGGAISATGGAASAHYHGKDARFLGRQGKYSSDPTFAEAQRQARSKQFASAAKATLSLMSAPETESLEPLGLTAPDALTTAADFFGQQVESEHLGLEGSASTAFTVGSEAKDQGVGLLADKGIDHVHKRHLKRGQSAFTRNFMASPERRRDAVFGHAEGLASDQLRRKQDQAGKDGTFAPMIFGSAPLYDLQQGSDRSRTAAAQHVVRLEQEHKAKEKKRGWFR